MTRIAKVLISLLVVMTLLLIYLGSCLYTQLTSLDSISYNEKDNVTDSKNAFHSTPTVKNTATPQVFELSVKVTLTPSSVPTATPKVIDYVFADKVDFSNSWLVAMAITKPDGTVIKTNWASAIAYQDGDPDDVFDPHKGTIYSYKDSGYVTTWAHSGYLLNGSDLYGYALEKAVWLHKYEEVLTLAEGRYKVSDLIGSSVVICQATPDSGLKAFDEYDHSVPCPGKQIEMVLRAAVLVERENVDSYREASGEIVYWLAANYPGSGFESLDKDDSYLVQICVGKYSDQESDGTINYLYNRLIIGMSLK